VQGVFVAEKDTHGHLRARFIPVTTGITGTTDIEVLSGLSPGQEVVTGPYKTLRDLKGGSLLKRDTEKPVTITSEGSS
jgi:HlyD family secretion protein